MPRYTDWRGVPGLNLYSLTVKGGVDPVALVEAYDIGYAKHVAVKHGLSNARKLSKREAKRLHDAGLPIVGSTVNPDGGQKLWRVSADVQYMSGTLRGIVIPDGFAVVMLSQRDAIALADRIDKAHRSGARVKAAGTRNEYVYASPSRVVRFNPPRMYGKRAGQFVRQEMHEIGKSKRVRSRKQAVAVGLSRARRAGVKVPRQNPALMIFGNPPRPWDRAAVLSRRAVAIEYDHVQGGKLYRHGFSKGVTVEALADGSVRLYRPDGKPIWRMFNA